MVSRPIFGFLSVCRDQVRTQGFGHCPNHSSKPHTGKGVRQRRGQPQWTPPSPPPTPWGHYAKFISNVHFLKFTFYLTFVMWYRSNILNESARCLHVLKLVICMFSTCRPVYRHKYNKEPQSLHGKSPQHAPSHIDSVVTVHVTCHVHVM